MKRFLVSILYICCSCSIVLGASSNQFTIDFNPSDGLPNTNINSVCQDSFKRIWVGTKRGVFYHTGNRFVALQNTDYTSSCSKNTSMIAIDERDRLWIFSEEGSGYYDILDAKFTNIPQLKDLTVTDIDFDTDGNAWITSSEGICRYSIHDSSFTIETELSHLTPYKSNLHDDDKIVFTALDNNIYIYNYVKKSLRAVKIDNVSSLSLIERSGISDFIVLDDSKTVYLLNTPPTK